MPPSKHFLQNTHCHDIISSIVVFGDGCGIRQQSSFSILDVLSLKSASSRLIKKEHSVIRESLWKEYFWSRSFCLLTTGGAPMEVVRRYIESQGE